MDVAAIVFAGADGVVQLVVFSDQRFPAQAVLENPVFESVLNGTLFGLCRLGFGKIGYTLFIAVFVPNNVEDFGGSQIQSVFQKMIGIDPLGAVGRCDLDVAVAITLVGQIPTVQIFVIGNLNVSLPEGGREQFIGKLLDGRWLDPCGTKTHRDFRSCQIPGLHLFQCLYIDAEGRVLLGGNAGGSQFLPHITGQILVSRQIDRAAVLLLLKRLHKNNAGQFPDQRLLVFSGQLHHVGHIHPRTFSDAQGKCVRGGFRVGGGAIGTNGAFGENIGFALEIPLVIQNLQRTEQEIAIVVPETQ